MPCALPQELIDRVLDELHWQAEDDLRTCTFVCRAWRASAHRHLFSDLLFDYPSELIGVSPSVCHDFRELLHTSPELARHVRHVEVCDDHPWFIKSADVFFDTVSRFAGMTTLDLSFCAVSWKDMKDVSGILTSVFALPALLRISIDDIFDIPLDELFVLFRESSVRELSLSNLEINSFTDRSWDHERFSLKLDVLTLALNEDYHARSFTEWLSDPASVVDLSISTKLCICIANSTEAIAAGTLLENSILQRPITLELQALNCFAHVDQRATPLPPLLASYPRLVLSIFETASCFSEPFCGSALGDIVMWWTSSLEALQYQLNPEETPNIVEDVGLMFSQTSAANFHTIPTHIWHRFDAALAAGLPQLKTVSVSVDGSEMNGCLLLTVLKAFPRLYEKQMLRFPDP